MDIKEQPIPQQILKHCPLKKQYAGCSVRLLVPTFELPHKPNGNLIKNHYI